MAAEISVAVVLGGGELLGELTGRDNETSRVLAVSKRLKRTLGDVRRQLARITKHHSARTSG
jgi:hypothetical protein